MARRTFIRLQLRKSSCVRFWCYFLVHTFKIKKFESISSNLSRDIAKSLKISFGSSFVNFRAFGSKFWQFRFPVYTFQTNKTALDYLYPFLSFSVHNFCARTDRHFSKKFSFFFLIKNIYTYMSIPISIISQISTPCDQSYYTFFFHIGNRYEIPEDAKYRMLLKINFLNL